MKTSFWIVISAALMVICSCSPKVTEPVVEAPPQQVVQQPRLESLTDCITFDDLDRSLRDRTEDAYVIYRDQIRFEKWDRAREIWKQAYYNAPGANGRVKYQYDDGIKIYDHYFKQATDTDVQAALVDTILSIYDKRVECFEDDGTMLARKAFNSYYSYRDYVDDNNIFVGFKEVLDKKGKEADYFIINPLSRMLYDRVLDKDIEVEIADNIAYDIFEAIDHGLETCEGEYCDAWDVINEYSPNLLSGLEGIRGFYNCDYYMDRYFDQYLQDSTDCDNVTEVYLKMVWAQCDREDPRVKRLKNAKDKECYVAPPPPGPLKLAYNALNEGRFEESIGHYEQYISETDDPIKKAEKQLLISKIYYAHIKNFVAARTYARQAAKSNPNWGEPYILIGKLYASSGPLCGSGRGWNSQIVTWPAIDQFEKAKSVDPSVAAEANKWINQYTKYMPSTGDIFQRGLKEGSSFKVGCWIQESTIIRGVKG